MEFALWSAIIGLLLVTMALGNTVLARLPLSTSMLYVLAGIAVSPLGFALASFTPFSNVALLEHMAEVVVLLSLFTSGLKMSVGINDGRWLLPVRLAVVSMLVTVAGVAAVGFWLLDLPLGAGVLLGAILAPTDPVLAADVQVAKPGDRDRLRFALTGEAGLNDGTAFPLVLLGLGLLGLHDIGSQGMRWIALDVAWPTVAGLAIGALMGTAVGRLVLYLRLKHKEAVGLDNFLALGLIALAYGGALLASAYGFLAVFAAGVAFRRIEQRETSAATSTAEGATRAAFGAGPSDAAAPASTAVVAAALASGDDDVAEKVATHPQHAPAYMAHAVQAFNEQMERIGEVAAVMVVGMLVWTVDWHLVPWWFIPVLLLVIRPLSVAIGLAGSRTSRGQRALIAWFGIRGIGSLYYLMYALRHQLAPELAAQIVSITLAAVVVSITAHGVSVTPLMALYERSKLLRGRRRRAAD